MILHKHLLMQELLLLLLYKHLLLSLRLKVHLILSLRLKVFAAGTRVPSLKQVPRERRLKPAFPAGTQALNPGHGYLLLPLNFLFLFNLALASALASGLAFAPCPQEKLLLHLPWPLFPQRSTLKHDNFS